MRDLSEKIVVITGAASGLGLALAHRFAELGANPVLCDIDAAALERAIAAVPRATGRVVDVSDRTAVDAFSAWVAEQHGRIDVLVNNAGVTSAPKPLLDTSDELVEWILKVNLWGVYHCTRSSSSSRRSSRLIQG